MTRGVVGLETAFTAEYTNGKEGRRIGFCSEYDALPGLVYILFQRYAHLD